MFIRYRTKKKKEIIPIFNFKNSEQNNNACRF